MTTATRETEIRQAIIAYISKHDRCPNWPSVGTDYHEGKPVFDAMLADSSLVWETRISPKGRKMQVIRLGK